MVLRWTAASPLEAQKTFRRLKAYRPAAHPPERSPGALEKGSGLELVEAERFAETIQGIKFKDGEKRTQRAA